jgi:hypothetical protein
MNTNLRIIFLCGIVATVSVACASSGGSIIPPPTTPGGQTGGGSVGSGGGSTGRGGDPGVGIEVPVGPGAGGQTGPGGGQATIVVPKPGRLDAHPVGANKVEAIVSGRKVTVRLSWWSGVAPCSVLDSVGVAQNGSDIVLTIREGADQRGVACIELAMLKGTIVDLGELAPGAYTISAGGEAPPIQVVVD